MKDKKKDNTEIKKRFPTWVKGFMYKKQIVKHPYLEIGFKFDSDSK